MTRSADFIKWFDEIRNSDIALVGGKNASLGELYGNLRAEGIAVPNGFALTTKAYYDALTRAGAWEKLHRILDALDIKNVEALSKAAAEARDIVYDAMDDTELHDQVAEAYARLEAEYGPGVSVAVRSSATAEDLPTASFAGQHESFLNVAGHVRLFAACRRCFASLFTDRAIVYRADNGFDHFKVGLSVGVMKMVRSDEAASGVIFTLDPETGFRDALTITGSYGLGENIVQGKVDPDEFSVHKPTCRKGFRPIIGRSLGAKQFRMGFARLFSEENTHNSPTPQPMRERFCISDDEVLKLASLAIRIEDHYSAIAGKPTPMDIEWAKDGEDGGLYIVQARPMTAVKTDSPVIETYRLKEKGQIVVIGKAVGAKIASGKARVVKGAHDLESFQPGEILVAEATSPDWQPVMKKTAGIVTDLGGRTCHAAIVARELGVPAVVGTGNATRQLKTGDVVTVSCADAETGTVYAGQLPFEVIRTPVGDTKPHRTEVMINLGDPAAAFGAAALPSAGVGLARMEFIISEHIGIHPMALVQPERVTAIDDRLRIAERIRHDANGREFFVRQLAEGVGKIAAAFYPRPVIVRLSDFKTNEYAQLLGGADFEPKEANPMLGFRGAARYTHPAYADGFALECEALRRVREQMGLTNLRIMVPFCRTVREAEAVVEALAKHGLKQGKDGMQIFVMCEIPNNVIEIDAFARVFDGFSIGSNDLTQLTLGVDRDSDIVAFDFDERDPGMLEMLRLAVDGAKRNHRHVGICGEAPANYPEIVRYLVRQGIDSISVNPTSVMKTIDQVWTAENALKRIGPRRTGARRSPLHARPAANAVEAIRD